MLTLSDIQEARHTLGDIARRTPLHLTHTFSRLAGCEVWLKLENLQKTGSFKIRGSYNKISRLPEDAKNMG